MPGSDRLRPAAPPAPRALAGSLPLVAVLAAALAALDLAVKAQAREALYGLPPQTALPWLLDFYLVYNRGIAFSLLPTAPGTWGHWLLLACLFLATAAVLWMAVRSRRRWEMLGWTAIAGGALGNALDRAARGYVTDYLHLHLGELSLFIFNLADFAISLGVALLLYDAFLAGGKPDSEATPSGRPV